MTRENKLALVVGFGLILFVGILISDHFSIARTQASANLANQKIADPLVARTRDEPDLIALKPPPQAPPQPPAAASPAQPAVSPGELTARDPAVSEQMSPEQRTMVDRSVDLAAQPGAAAAPPAASDSGVTPVSPDSGPVPAADAQGIRTLATHEVEPIGIEGFDPAKPERAVNLKDLRFHDVQGGESMFSICKEHYGTTALVDELASFNKMTDPAQVRAGRRLVIPPAEALGGKSTLVASAAGASPGSPREGSDPKASKTVSAKPPASKPAPDSRPTTSSKPVAPRTYTIKDGDSLSGIAQRLYGDRDKWRQLHKLNRKVIDDPDDLKVGTVIRLM